MKFIKLMMVLSIFLSGLLFNSCKKETYLSRDTSGLVPPDDPDDPDQPDPTFVLFDSADSDTGWEIVGPKSVETTGMKEGKGYLKSTIKQGEDYMHFIKKPASATNPNLTKENGQLTFWFYVSNVADIKADGQVEISSSGESDKKELAWPVASLLPSLKNGWNEVKLNFKDGESTSDGGADIAAINFFRIFFWTNDKNHADLTVGVDAVGFVASSGTPGGPAQEWLFDGADSDAGWEIVGPKSVETSGKKEGTGYLKSTIVKGEDYMHFIKKASTPLVTGLTKANGQLSFWFYVSSVADLKEDGQIELTSSGESDKKEYAWSVAKLIPTLKNGWNEIKLNFSDAELSSDGGPDLAAGFNFFRIYFWTKDKNHEDVTVGVDGIKLSVTSGGPAPISVAFDSADSDKDWEVVGPKSIETSGKKEGTGYLKSAILKGEDYMHFIKRAPAAINPGLTKENGQFAFWFYVSDVSTLKEDGQIELTSSGKSDSKEYAWSVAKLIPTLKNGWNEVKLNFSDAEVSADGEPDLAALNFFRIYFWTKDKAHDDVAVGVDDLRFLSK
ncbi:hypothetical protein GS399_18220 [Pedobacter sp. HMF7647]|uniref:Uncharacterized protein n=1 Tax=Hufsiella arboris TaxID=2695275 RepID=A0A7K1YE78_9SPHI|nr:hypothetical protein [Hufsiella arboris]MXV52914.1 hypothetical protein [Hufsiella arboris]